MIQEGEGDTNTHTHAHTGITEDTGESPTLGQIDTISSQLSKLDVIIENTPLHSYRVCRTCCNLISRLLRDRLQIKRFPNPIGSKATTSLPEIKCVKHSFCLYFSSWIFGSLASTIASLTYATVNSSRTTIQTQRRFSTWSLTTPASCSLIDAESNLPLQACPMARIPDGVVEGD